MIWQLVLIYFHLCASGCLGADGVLASIEAALDFDCIFECPLEVYVDQVFSCNLTITGGERILATVQWEGRPPLNFQFNGMSFHFDYFY